MIAVTGASGQLGRLVIAALLERVPAASIVALARDPAALADLADAGVDVRAFDYDRAETLVTALAGVDRLLLISSSDLPNRQRQHQAVIDAAGAAGVGFLAYTSILHADRNPMDLAVDHRATEAMLSAGGIPYALLRNGWYTENHAQVAPMAVEHGAVSGSARDGRISAASRADYALAAATVLTAERAESRTYELAGDDSFTLADLAWTIGDISGRPVHYHDMPEPEYRTMLEAIGLPAPLAAMLAESDAKAADGALYDDGHDLSRLIGRPTTPLRDVVAAALQP